MNQPDPTGTGCSVIKLAPSPHDHRRHLERLLQTVQMMKRKLLWRRLRQSHVVVNVPSQFLPSPLNLFGTKRESTGGSARPGPADVVDLAAWMQPEPMAVVDWVLGLSGHGSTDVGVERYSASHSSVVTMLRPIFLVLIRLGCRGSRAEPRSRSRADRSVILSSRASSGA